MTAATFEPRPSAFTPGAAPQRPILSQKAERSHPSGCSGILGGYKHGSAAGDAMADAMGVLMGDVNLPIPSPIKSTPGSVRALLGRPRSNGGSPIACLEMFESLGSVFPNPDRDVPAEGFEPAAFRSGARSQPQDHLS